MEVLESLCNSLAAGLKGKHRMAVWAENIKLENLKAKEQIRAGLCKPQTSASWPSVGGIARSSRCKIGMRMLHLPL